MKQRVMRLEPSSCREEEKHVGRIGGQSSSSNTTSDAWYRKVDASRISVDGGGNT